MFREDVSQKVFGPLNYLKKMGWRLADILDTNTDGQSISTWKTLDLGKVEENLSNVIF